MTKILTPNFKTHMAVQFYESINEQSNNIYYAFAGRSQIPFSNDSDPPTPNTSYSDVTFDVYEEMVFGKKITPQDFIYTVTRRVWNTNTVYTAYDDRDDTLSEKAFYVASPESSSYHVFKCLDNNGGVPSTDQPLLSETSAADDFYQTADGYIWKYMYTITNSQWAQFSSNCGMPVYTNANVVANAVAGTIESIVVEDPGLNYNAYANGTFSVIGVGGDATKYTLQSEDFALSTNTNFYTDSQIYLKSGTGAGQIRNITAYNGVTKTITIDEEFSILPDGATIWFIGPKVSITGDGNSAQAVAYIDTTANSIANLQMIDVGSGYSYANVVLTSNSGVSASSLTPAEVRAIISPKGGHGANAAAELYTDKVTIAFAFANTEGNTIPTNNVIRTVGVLKDPTFNELTLTFGQDGGSPTESDWTVGETITQDTTNARGTVVSASGTSLTLSNITGFFEVGNTTYKYITGGTSGTNTSVTAVGNSFDTFDQRTVVAFNYSFTGSDGGGFDVDEFVYQGSISNPAAFGYVHSVGNNTIYLTEVVGTFSNSSTIIGNTSASIATITSITEPDIVQNSGDVLYLENFSPIERSTTQSEEFKIVIEF